MEKFTLLQCVLLYPFFLVCTLFYSILVFDNPNPVPWLIACAFYTAVGQSAIFMMGSCAIWLGKPAYLREMAAPWWVTLGESCTEYLTRRHCALLYVLLHLHTMHYHSDEKSRGNFFLDRKNMAVDLWLLGTGLHALVLFLLIMMLVSLIWIGWSTAVSLTGCPYGVHPWENLESPCNTATPILPKGLALPCSLSRVLAFIPCWPFALMQLREVTVHAATVDLTFRDKGTHWTDSSRALSLGCVGWPLLTAVFLSAALTETVCKQWVWYRLLQHRVIMDFKSSEKDMFGRIKSDPGCWWMGFGFVLMECSAYANGIGHMACVGPFASLALMYIFFVTEAESSQLPTVNAFVKGDFDENIMFLSGCTWVKEEAVVQAAMSQWRFHSLAAEAVRYNKIRNPSILHQRSDRFWSMQLLGLAPLSGILQGYKRLQLKQALVDYKYANTMRGWLIFFLIGPCAILAKNNWAYFGWEFAVAYVVVVASPTVITYVLSTSKQVGC